MTTQKVVDHLTAGIEEEEGGEELGEEENNDHYIELARGELAEDGEESGEGEVEGSQGGDRPGGEGKGGAHLRSGIPHVRHSQCKYPPKSFADCVCHADVGDGEKGPNGGNRPRSRPA